MARGIELATAYISLAVSADGIGSQVARQFGGIEKVADDTGRRAGRAMASSINASSGSVDLSKVRAEFERNSRAAEQAGKAVEAAHHRQAQSTKAVEVAQLKLSEARSKYGAGSSQVAAAEMRVADAQYKSDLASQRLAAATASADQAKAKAAKSSSDLARAEEVAGDEAQEASGKVDKFGKSARDAGKDADSSEKGVSRLGKALGGAFKVGALAAAGAAVAGIGVALKSGFDRLVSIDDARAKLRGLGHDAQAVDGIMDSALASVKGTAFGLGDAATLAASAVAAGVPAGQELTKYLSLAGDAATIAGVSLNEMGSIFGKVQTSQRAYTAELNQLADRGIPIYQWLQEELGVSAEALRDMVSAGKVDSATFFRVIQENIGGAALEAGNSFSGALKNVRAAIGRVGAAFLEPAFQQGPKIFAGLITLLDQLAPLAEGLGAAFGQMVQGAVDSLAPLGTALKVIAGIELSPDEMGWLAKLMSDSPLAADAIFSLRNSFVRLQEATGPLVQAYKDLWAIIGPFIGDVIKLAGGAALGALVVAFDLLSRIVTVTWGLLAQLTGFLRENEFWVKLLASAVLGAVVALKVYHGVMVALGVINTVVKAVRSFSLVTTVATAKQWLLNAAMRANPIGIIVTLIGLLVGALVYAWKNSETFRRVVTGAWEGIKAAVGAVVGWFTNTVAPFFVGLWEKIAGGKGGDGPGLITRAWQGIKDFFSGLWNAIVSGVQWFIDFVVGLFLKFHPVGIIISHWEGIVAWFQGLWQRVSGAFMAGLNAIWNVVGPWVMWFMGVFQAAWGVLQFLIALPIRLAQLAIMAAWEGIKWLFQAAWDWVSGVFMALWNTIAPLIGAAIDAAAAWVGRQWDWITNKFSAAWAWVSGVFMGWWRTLAGLIGFVIDEVAAWVGRGWDWITSKFSQAWSWVSGTFMGWWRTLSRLIGSVMDAALAWVRRVWDWITDKFSQAWSWVNTTFRGWWDQLTSLMETPIQKAREAIDTILDGIKKAFETAVDFVKTTWDRIKEAVAAPVRIAIEIGNKLIGGFRTVAKAVGLDSIAEKLVDIPPLPQYYLGGRADRVGGSAALGRDSTLAVTAAGVPLARVNPGEGIVRNYAMDSLDRSYPGFFEGLNRGGAGYLNALGLPRFFLGGTMPTTSGRVSQHPHPYYNTRWAGDLARPAGTPVYAWGDGTVAQIRRRNVSYGHDIVINHEIGSSTRYAHLLAGSIAVAVGQAVRAGQRIASVGSTGNSSGPHLHFELIGGTHPLGSADGGDEGGGFFDWVGNLVGRFTGPLKDLNEKIGSSPLGEIVKTVPKMVADGMVEKVKEAASKLFDSGAMSGAVASGSMDANAKLILDAAKSLGMPLRAAIIALMTVAQESSAGTNRTAMTRINRDGDVGWYQQRATRGDGGLPLGSQAAIQRLADPLYSTRVFYRGITLGPGTQYPGWHVPGLLDKNWQNMGLGQAAQAVQVSAFPSAYDKWESWARRMVAQYGYWRGTHSARAGITRLAEKGPELVTKPGTFNLAGRERVFNAQDTASLLNGQTVYNFSPIIREGESTDRQFERFVWEVEHS